MRSLLGESLPCLKLEASRDGDREEIFSGTGSCTSRRDEQYDQLTTMLRQEERDGYHCCDYLQNYSSNVDDSVLSLGEKSINELCRTSIAEWMYRVVDHFRVDREGKLTASTITCDQPPHLLPCQNRSYHIFFIFFSRCYCYVIYRPCAIGKSLCR